MVKLQEKLHEQLSQMRNLSASSKKKITAVCVFIFVSLLAFVCGKWLADSAPEEVQLDTAAHIQVADAVPEHRFGRIYSVDNDLKGLKDPFAYEGKSIDTAVQSKVSTGSTLIAEKLIDNSNESKVSAVSIKKESISNRNKSKNEKQPCDLKAILNISGSKSALADVGGKVVRLAEGSSVGSATVASIKADRINLLYADGTVKAVMLR